MDFKAGAARWQDVWTILNPKQRRAGVAFFVASVGGMLLEMLGVGLVLPTFALLASEDGISRYPMIARFIERFGHPTHGQVVVAGMLALIAIYLVKELYLTWLAWRQMQFIYDVQAELSHRVYQRYLAQPYPFHLQRNSAQLIRNAITETNVFAQVVLTAGLQVLTEALIGFGIAMVMLWVEPVGTLLVLGMMSLAVFAFHRATSRRIADWGSTRQTLEGARIQHLQQGLGGIKEVKLAGSEDVFLAAFDHANDVYAAACRRYGFIAQMPRLSLEFLGVAGLCVFVLVMLAAGRPAEAVMSTLGLFAIGAFRLMPSANRVLSGAQSVRYGFPVIHVLSTELASLEKVPPASEPLPFPTTGTIELERVTFRYPDAPTPTIDNVSLTIPRGSCTGFVGTTGAGKTTLIDTILGLLRPSSGRVLVDGVDIATNLSGWQAQIGYVPQTIYLTDESLRQNIAFGVPRDQIDDRRIHEVLALARLDAFVRELPQGLDTVVGERGVRLSGGQRQRIGIARALYHDPAVIVLDEATSALDVATEAEVLEAVRVLHGLKTVLVIAHRPQAVAACDLVFRLEQGRLAEPLVIAS